MTLEAPRPTTALPRDQLLARLVDTWLETYRQAVAAGLTHRTSGPDTDDPHCAAATALVCKSHDGFPWVYGGVVVAPAVNRWSANKRAALATFELGVRLGLSARVAARAVYGVRHLARERLGLPRGLQFQTELWVTDQATRDAAARRWEVQNNFLRLADYLRRVTWSQLVTGRRDYMIGCLEPPVAGSPDAEQWRWLFEPLTQRESVVVTDYQDRLIFEIERVAAVLEKPLSAELAGRIARLRAWRATRPPTRHSTDRRT